jgi:hypothetical protein
MAVKVLRALAASSCVVVFACSFSGAGQGKGSGMLGDEGDDGGTGGSGSDAGEGSTAAGGDDQGPGDDDGDGSAGPDDGTADGPPEVGGAEVVFVAGASIDLGAIDPTSAVPLPPLVLRNDGALEAEGLSGGPLVPPLSWAGGAFPGTGGTCGGTLAPGQTCDIVLAPSPGPFGLSSQELAIEYEDSGLPESAVAQVDVVGIGTSEDLVVNGAFTDGNAGSAPPSWMVLSGGWYTTNNQGVGDMRSVFAGPAQVGSTVSLAQDVALAPWADTIASAGLGLRVEGVARAQATDTDVWLTVVTELDEGGGTILTHATDPGSNGNWGAFLHEYPLNPGTRAIRIELQCVMNNGTNCNTWFDAVQAHVMYPPPGG